MSEHLTRNNVAHVVLEKGRIAERWRSMRWDSLVANGPAWHDRFPNLNFPGNADAFVSKKALQIILKPMQKVQRTNTLWNRGNSSRAPGRSPWLPCRDI